MDLESFPRSPAFNGTLQNLEKGGRQQNSPGERVMEEAPPEGSMPTLETGGSPAGDGSHGEWWENTVDKAVWSQPAQALDFRTKGLDLVRGSGSQRRLGKRVDLMKEFLIHGRKAIAQLIFLLRKQPSF